MPAYRYVCWKKVQCTGNAINESEEIRGVGARACDMRMLHNGGGGARIRDKRKRIRAILEYAVSSLITTSNLRLIFTGGVRFHPTSSDRS